MKNIRLSKLFTYTFFLVLFFVIFGFVLCFGFFGGTKTKYRDNFVMVNYLMKYDKERLETIKIESALYRDSESPCQSTIKAFFSDFNVIDLCIAVDKRDIRNIDRFLTKNKNNFDPKQGSVDPNSLGEKNVSVLLWSLLTLVPGAIAESLTYAEKGGTDEEIKNIQMFLEDRVRCIERLLYYGADPNVKVTETNNVFLLSTKEGASFTFLSAARLYGNSLYSNSPKNQINLLPTVLKHGGDPNIVYTYYHATPIFAACNPSVQFGTSHTRKGVYISSSMPAFFWASPCNVALLIEAGADIEFRDKWRNTPLIVAAGGENFDIVLILLEAGADYTAENEDGENLAYFLYAAKHTNPKIDTEQSIDPYYNKVLDFLKAKEYSLDDAYAKLSDKLKKLPPLPAPSVARMNQRP